MVLRRSVLVRPVEPRMLLAGVVVVLVSGCATQPTFPTPLVVQRSERDTAWAFDTDGDHRPDFWEYQDAAGRKHAIAYAAPHSDQPGARIELAGPAAAECPHYVIALDGVPFEVVDELYRAGHFRFFHPPARVVCCYPSMTDLALTDVFQTGRCHAFQALYFDRAANRLSDSSAGYLSGENSPWLRLMNYRCSLWWDVLVYLDPQIVFQHELSGIVRTFRGIERGEGRAYSVGTAGLGTRGGRAAMRQYLRTIDRLCEQLIYERRGRVNITLTADHGHDLTENHRVDFDPLLRAGGYRPAKTLRDPRDVVTISYGLVTYAEFFTPDAPGVGACLLGSDDVDLVCYPTAAGVVVRARDGEALIAETPTGLRYDAQRGDPLRLNPIIEALRAKGQVADDGSMTADAWFAATCEHDYPDAPPRLWRTFHGLVDDPPDLIANLRDGACHGARFFEAMIGEAASTHGSLNRRNSTTFVMTTLGEMPPAMRSADIGPAIEQLRSATPGQ